jgi:hypothetical protein
VGTLNKFDLSQFEGGLYIYELKLVRNGEVLEKGKIYLKR